MRFSHSPALGLGASCGCYASPAGALSASEPVPVAPGSTYPVPSPGPKMPLLSSGGVPVVPSSMIR